ncbi:hypothetical protein [Deinococcus wulumuqiensis]|uniref:hypothetical protein n=1 Tax=Deinococcus wulumuqiensis TaxID=980427 RepID=UPI00242BD991|nr:hypothetical protein [Deinococcus wulumuqiensis]
MSHTSLLSARIAGLESLVLNLPELRVTAAELQTQLAALKGRVAEVDALIHEGESAERTLAHLGELADRVLAAGTAMVPPVPALEPAPSDVPQEETPVQEDPHAPLPATDATDVAPEASDELELEPDASDEVKLDVAPPDETPEESPADAPAGEDEASEEEPREDAAAPQEAPSALTLDSLRAYLGQHPGSLPEDMVAHFGTTKTVLASLLGTLRRQGGADCVLAKPPRWYLMADLPQTKKAPSAAPLPELPPAPEEATTAPAEVKDEDLRALISHLGVQGNRTELQIYKTFRYARNWTPEYVTQLVREGMSQGKLASAGGTASQPRIGLVRGSFRGGLQ